MDAVNWTLAFDVIEQVRAHDLGRNRMRREERRMSDDAVVLTRLSGEELDGWALDRSDGGARTLLSAASEPFVLGEIVTLALRQTSGDESRLARVVWAQQHEDASVVGLELVAVSGEIATADLSLIDLADVA